MTSHTRPWKEKQLSELKQLASSYPVVAVADVNMYPAALFQQVRKKLKKNSVVKVSKTKIIKQALSEVKDTNILVDDAKENCALIFTEMNPFELYAFLKKNKGRISAKVGAIAEEDISIPAGDTGIPPGPALTDLKSAGLKVAIQGPTISIMQAKVVTKAGEPVNAAVAGTLSKLNIKPFKVGLKIISVLEQGQVYKADVLDIDIDEVFGNFVNAHKKAFNLAVNTEIFTSETTELLISKAFNNAKAVALEANILNSATVGSLLAKANAQASALKPLIKDAPKEEPKEEAKEEAKEEKKEEVAEEEKKEETPEPEAKETPKEEAPAEEKQEDTKGGDATEGN
ncbi:MAG: 50S ribosomal protein L10 [Candidatus Diapherotrites archaeon]